MHKSISRVHKYVQHGKKVTASFFRGTIRRNRSMGQKGDALYAVPVPCINSVRFFRMREAVV